jgi:hypothetical protein
MMSNSKATPILPSDAASARCRSRGTKPERCYHEQVRELDLLNAHKFADITTKADDFIE